MYMFSKVYIGKYYRLYSITQHYDVEDDDDEDDADGNAQIRCYILIIYF